MDDFFAIMDLVMKEDAPTGFFNVSTGAGHTIREIFELVAAHLGVKLDAPPPDVEPGPDDVAAMVLDPTKTQQILGWRAKHDFKAIIERMLAWYDRHGVTAIFSHLRAPAAMDAARPSEP
jgi:UDP-glucose 4-epimerase